MPSSDSSDYDARSPSPHRSSSKHDDASDPYILHSLQRESLSEIGHSGARWLKLPLLDPDHDDGSGNEE